MNADEQMFYITLGGIFVGIIGLILKTAYKIKIKDCNLCFGLIHTVRDTEDEMKIDMSVAGGGSNEISTKRNSFFSSKSNDNSCVNTPQITLDKI